MKLDELQALERDHVIGTYARNPVQFVRGEGTRLWDEHGDEYLDFLAGISVLNVGHCHPRVVQAVQQQAATLTHASNLYYTAGAIQLSAALAQSAMLSGRPCSPAASRRPCCVARAPRPAQPTHPRPGILSTRHTASTTRAGGSPGVSACRLSTTT